MITRFATAFVASLALLTPLAASAQDRISLSASRVAVYNIAGDVRVERGTGANVVVEVTRQGDDAAELEVRRTEQGGWQSLVVHYPGKQVVYPRKGLGRMSRTEFSVDADGTFGMNNLDPDLGTDRITAKTGSTSRDRRIRVVGSGSGLKAHADLRIIVPAGKAVALHLGVGSVTVGNVDGDLQVDSRSGAVRVVDTRGFLRVDTGSGAIEVDQVAGDVALNTGSGSVEASRIGNGVLKIHTGSGGVELAAITAREMSVSTGSGSIAGDGITAPTLKLETGSGGIRTRRVSSSKFDMHTGSGSIQLDLLGDIDVGRIRSGSGGVTITTTRALGTDVTLDTGSGGIDVQIPLRVHEKRKSFLRGTIGDGNGMLDVGTGSGGIALR